MVGSPRPPGRSALPTIRVLPEAVKMGLYDNVTLWDTASGGKAVKVMSAKGKKMTVHDQSRWDAFLAKGGEQ